ncbi:MAG: hypothetical protein P4L79_10175 [Legionella sp.]|uniref:hypothetical protein n=1 Tax=Legionella sp. TaxID=459 RepID=UPI002842CB00|nr:hypothetical protein [Legionella sp.]
MTTECHDVAMNIWREEQMVGHAEKLVKFEYAKRIVDNFMLLEDHHTKLCVAWELYKQARCEFDGVCNLGA